MNKKRIFPFGYYMENGTVQIHSQEAAWVNTLFHKFLQGIPITQLAKMSQNSGFCYHAGSFSWNKNMICRILEDRHYIGEKNHPPIIVNELFDQVTEKRLRHQQGKVNPIIRKVRNRIFCPSCSCRLVRAAYHTSNNMAWLCQNCNTVTTPIADQEILTVLQQHLNQAICNPQYIQPQLSQNNTISLAASRLAIEFERKFRDPTADSQYLLNLIQHCAQEKYLALGQGDQTLDTEQLLTVLTNSSTSEEFNETLFLQTISKVFLFPNGTIQVQFINKVVR